MRIPKSYFVGKKIQLLLPKIMPRYVRVFKLVHVGIVGASSSTYNYDYWIKLG